jgi:glutamyl-tRNA reductase
VAFIVVGLNHRTVPLGMLERVAIPLADAAKALRDLAGREHLAEVALLSTCDRTEVYAWCTRFHRGLAEVSGFLAAQCGVVGPEFGTNLYTFQDEAALTHFFGVAAGIDSMIPGGSEILGQVREALKAAQAEGTVGGALTQIFGHAIEVGRRARAETNISREAVSISSAAVALAEEHLGSLAGRRVLVLGAGKMGEGMARSLAGSGVAEVAVTGRRLEHAAVVAARVGARALTMEGLPDSLAAADVVLTATASTGTVIGRNDLEAAMVRRLERPLLVVDIAVPRDVDPAARLVRGVTLLDMDDLRAFAERTIDSRCREVARVRRIIAAELERCRSEQDAWVAPVVSALRARAEEVRQGELERFRSRLDGLDPGTAAAVEAMTRGIVDRLLHDPSVGVKKVAGMSRGRLYADALSALFDLEPGVTR